MDSTDSSRLSRLLQYSYRWFFSLLLFDMTSDYQSFALDSSRSEAGDGERLYLSAKALEIWYIGKTCFKSERKHALHLFQTHATSKLYSQTAFEWFSTPKTPISCWSRGLNRLFISAHTVIILWQKILKGDSISKIIYFGVVGKVT